MPRGVARISQVPAAECVADPPDRLAGHRQDDAAPADAAHFAEADLGVLEMFEDLERDDEVERSVRKRKVLGGTEHHGGVDPVPTLGERRRW